MKRYRLALLVVLWSGKLFAQNECSGPGQLINNGSFNGNLGGGVTAPGWTGTQSPDLNDAINGLHTTPCYFWIGTPVPSVNGGSWQNLFGVETVTQNCTLVAGQDYQICFEYAAQGIECPPNYIFDDPIGISLYINNVLIFSTPNDSTPYTWEFACPGFTAPSASVNIKFGTTSPNYVALDGVCLTPLSGLNEFSNFACKVLPNPFQDQLQVTNENNLALLFQLTDIRSGVLLEERLNSTSAVSTRHLAPGMYFYTITAPGGIMQTGKLIKE